MWLRILFPTFEYGSSAILETILKESQLQVEDDDPAKMFHYYQIAKSDEKERLIRGISNESYASFRLNYGFHDQESSGSSYDCAKSDGECFLAREIEWSQRYSLEAEDDDLGEQEVTSELLAMDTDEDEDDGLGEQEVTSKLLAMDTEGEGEGEGGDQGEETSWVEAFAQKLASLQDCVEEEGEDLLPNPFYQDKWVRGWERVPKHKPYCHQVGMK